MNDQNLNSVRIDKWLWAVRICKTRSSATNICKSQRVRVDEQKVKSSREVRVGQLVTVRRDGINRKFEVLQCIEKRVGAKIAKECCRDVTPQEELDKLNNIKGVWMPRRPKGAGRPTKKERRTIDRLFAE